MSQEGAVAEYSVKQCATRMVFGQGVSEFTHQRVLVAVRGFGPALPAQRSAGTPHQQLASDMVAGSLTADELLSRYCTIVYAQTGSYEAAARQLKLDRRTVKSKIDAALLEQLKDKG